MAILIDRGSIVIRLQVTKLAIGGENGFSLPEDCQYETSSQLACMQCPDAPEKNGDQFKEFIATIIDHKSLTKQVGWLYRFHFECM
jgi:hypothetical protein